MNSISRSERSEDYKRKAMMSVYEKLKQLIEKTLIAIDKAYEDGKININDYDEMNTVIENINSYFIESYGRYGEIEKEVGKMVKSFYDPRVEERGIEKGIEKGIFEEKKSVAKNMLLDGESDEKIKKYTGLDEENINKLKELIKIQGQH